MTKDLQPCDYSLDDPSRYPASKPDSPISSPVLYDEGMDLIRLRQINEKVKKVLLDVYF